MTRRGLSILAAFVVSGALWMAAAWALGAVLLVAARAINGAL